MATIKEIEDIHAWRKAREFAQKAYKISNQGTFARDFPLKDQLNRSSGSTMDNIAEGFGRGGNREFANFLSYARGSAEESKSQVYRAYDRKYITEDVLNELVKDVNEVSNTITGLIEYLRRSGMRGPKFMNR